MATSRSRVNGTPQNSSVPGAPEVGEALANFRLTSTLGTTGSIYPLFEAEDVALRRNVALKVFPKKMARGETSFELGQFLNEARSAALLDHPNVVRVYEIDESDGWHFIVMELVRGGHLGELVKRDGPLPADLALKYAVEAADGLDHAHQAGILHRDVKPANLLIGSGGECKLADFGLSRSIYGVSSHPTLNADPVGTPLYCAPEVIQGREAIPASDVYSLACVLWFMLTGSPPFRGKTVKSVFEQHMNNEPPKLSSVRPDAPSGLEELLLQCMSKAPEDRPATAAGFALALRKFTDVQLAGNAPAPVIVSNPAPNLRRLWWIPASAALMTGLVILAALPLVMSMLDRQLLSSAEKLLSLEASRSFTSTNWSDVEPAQTLPASNTPAMWRIINNENHLSAEERAPYAVEGTIRTAGYTEGGQTFNFSFYGGPRYNDFKVVLFPEMLSVFEREFGSPVDAVFVDQSIRVKGTFSVFRQSPQIVIRSLDQIELLPSDS